MDVDSTLPPNPAPPSRSRKIELDPTPEEIAAACEKIQSGWSEEERMIRARGVNRHQPDDK